MKTSIIKYTLLTLISFLHGCQSQKDHDPGAGQNPVSEERESEYKAEEQPESPIKGLSTFAFSDNESMQLSQSTFGRYVGTINLPAVNQELIARLDFITARSSDSTLELRAILSVFPGGFRSKEYVSYHFDDVKYDILTGTLVFTQPDQDLFIKSVDFKNGSLSAEVFSANSGLVGHLKFTINGTVQRQLPIVPSIWGSYGGSCEGQPSSLQLHTYRTTEEAARVGNPFAAYKISGSLSDSTTFDCGAGQTCVADVINSGSYDYFRGRLTLFGKRRSYTCNVSSAGIDCGSCNFSRTNTPHEVTLTPPLSKNQLLSATSEKVAAEGILKGQGEIAGTYTGYVHHEHLNYYQPATIDLTTFQERDASGQSLQLAAHARLYFGKHGNDENLSYKFHPVQFSLLSSLLLFERSEDDVDAVIQVVALGNGVIKGIWHSIQFGRVGTFELKKVPEPLLPGLMVIQPLAGIYQSSGGTLYLDVRKDTSPLGSLNPFFPNVFGGYLDFNSILSRRIEVRGGSYDFYTGRIGIETDSDGRTLTGEPVDNGDLLLRKPASDILRTEQEFTPHVYKRIP